MSTEPDSCRPVTLPSGETIRVRGAGEMGPAAVAALGEVVDAARRKMAAEYPPNPAAEALWARLLAAAAAEGMSLREIAKSADVLPSRVLRIGQGYMPDEVDLAGIEAWLTASSDSE